MNPAVFLNDAQGKAVACIGLWNVSGSIKPVTSLLRSLVPRVSVELVSNSSTWKIKALSLNNLVVTFVCAWKHLFHLHLSLDIPLILSSVTKLHRIGVHVLGFPKLEASAIVLYETKAQSFFMKLLQDVSMCIKYFVFVCCREAAEFVYKWMIGWTQDTC